MAQLRCMVVSVAVLYCWFARSRALVRARSPHIRVVDELWSRRSVCWRRSHAALHVRACAREVCIGRLGLRHSADSEQPSSL